MCVVSAVTDYGGRIWPDSDRWTLPIYPALPDNPLPTPVVPDNLDEIMKRIELGKNAKKKTDEEQGRMPTAEEIRQFLKLIEAAQKFDEIASQPHCEDPEKAKLIERLERRLANIETAIGVIDVEEAPAPHADTIALANHLFDYGKKNAISPEVAERFAAVYPNADPVDALTRANAAYEIINGFRLP